MNGAPGRASRPGPGSAPEPVFRPDNPSLQLPHGREGLVVGRHNSRAVFPVDFGADFEPQRGAVLLVHDAFHEELFEAVAERELRLAKALTEELILEPLADLEVGDSGGSPSSAQCADAPELAEEAPFPVTWSAVPWFLARAPGLFTALWGSGGMRLAGTDGLWLHGVMVGSGCGHGQWADVAGGGGSLVCPQSGGDRRAIRESPLRGRAPLVYLPPEGVMPFEDLVHVIETLRERIKAHRQDLESNETRTRMALIDPLLRALGWDTEDPALVLPEYESSGRADYALLGSTGKPSAVIEAKRLGESLANHQKQMVTYANMSGIPYAGLTDGNIWEFYKVFDPKPIEERLMLRVSISKDAVHEAALKLLLLWRPNLAAGQPVQPSAPVLDDSTERQPPPAAPEPSPESTAPPPTGGWVALTKLETPGGTPAPSAIRFVDGQEASITSWRSLLVATARWLDSKGLIPPDASIPSGRKRYVLHTISKHQRGNEFRSPVPLGQSGTYLETHASAGELVRYATKLLSEFRQDLARVYVRPRA